MLDNQQPKAQEANMSLPETTIIKYREYLITILPSSGSQFTISFEGPQEICRVTCVNSKKSAIKQAKEMVDEIRLKYATKVDGFAISTKYNKLDAGWEYQAIKKVSETESTILGGRKNSYRDTALKSATLRITAITYALSKK